MDRRIIDLSDLKCPRVIIEALKSINSRKEDEILEVKITDKLATKSIPDSAREMGYQVIVNQTDESEWLITIS